MSKIAFDFMGEYAPRYSVFEADSDGHPVHPLGCECLGESCPNWYFVPHAKQIQFFDADVPYVLFGGGRGGGKTAGLTWDAVFEALLVPGSRTIIFRRTMGELKKTIIDGFLNLPKGIWTRCTEDGVSFENGSKVWFGSADDEKSVRKQLSGEFDRVLFDEWSEWPYSMWKFVTGSCRSTRDKDIFNRPVIAQVKGATNPGGTGGATLAHLFGCSGEKKQAPGEDPSLYEPSEYTFIQSLVSDNPAYSSDRPAGIAYRKMLNSQPRRIRAAWLEGRWDGFEGQYFDCLDNAVATLPHDDYLRLASKQHWSPIWISIDWGMVHFASVGWHRLLEIGGRQYPVTFRTYMNKGLGEAALAQEIADMTEKANQVGKVVKIYLSPETFGDTRESRARRMGDVFVANKLPRPHPANNSREDGLRLMHDLLRVRYTGVEVFPETPPRTLCGWLITDHNTEGPNEPPGVLECLAQATCDPKHDGDILKEGDAPHLDMNDQLRYGIASHIHPIAKPFGETVKEELAKIPMEGPGRYIKHLQLKQKERNDHSGVFYIGRKPRRGR